MNFYIHSYIDFLFYFIFVLFFFICSHHLLLHFLFFLSSLFSLSLHSNLSYPISVITYFPNNPSYPPTLEAYMRNLRFSSSTTPKPAFIVTPINTPIPHPSLHDQKLWSLSGSCFGCPNCGF